MDISTEIRARLQHDPGCPDLGFKFETLEPEDKPGTIRVSADCDTCEASIFDVELPEPEQAEPEA